MIHVTILGCGGSAGVPMIGGPDGAGDWGACDPAEPRNRRTRASIVIERDGKRLLVDCAPEMRLQVLACRVRAIDAILFTHAHADHILGLDDVRVLNRIADRPLEAFATAETHREIGRRFDYAVKPWTGPGFFRPVLEPRIVAPGETFDAAGIPVTVFLQDHGFGPTLGVRVGDFAYSTDAVGLDDAAFAALSGVHTWVVGCFQRAPHRTHAHVELALSWAARVAARRTVLTHLGPDLDWRWLAENLPPGVEAAADGLRLTVPA